MVISNIVGKESLRRVQLETMNLLKDTLVNSFGPFGSNTIIGKDNNGLPRYTKDGHTILSHILVNGDIEKSVVSDIEEETRTQAVKVGDSTTSITILSALIFEALVEYEKRSNINPAGFVEKYKKVTQKICDIIKSNGRPVTIEDMYKIALISTNGNKKLAETLKEVYNSYGLDVYIDVKASMNGTTYLKEINGMTLECGFLDPTLINDAGKNACTINNPKIYAFKDPIDTMEMGVFLDAILYKNIMKPIEDKDHKALVPTIIMAPRLSRDYSSYIDRLMQTMASLPTASRGWLNIITNIEGCDMEQYEDICDLCGCKYIKKYLDMDIQANDIKNGLAPTPENVHLFAGTAEQVVSDANKTSFIVPANMFNEDGHHTDLFNQRVDYLDKQIKKLEVEGNNTKDVYTLKKRLHSLKGKMVEIFIGGVTVADRDAERDLLEDAVLNCRSASKNGVGYAANFEGLRASNEAVQEYDNSGDAVEIEMAHIIYNAYKTISVILYDTMNNDVPSEQTVNTSLEKGCPCNVLTREFDKDVLTSIDTDVCILDTISKIVTIMATANQFMTPSVSINKY